MSGNIAGLRAQILDNLELLNDPDDLNPKDYRFAMIRERNGDWVVFLDRAEGFHNNLGVIYRGWDASKDKGRGATPELAYTDLLKKTADELAMVYGITFQDDSE